MSEKAGFEKPFVRPMVLLLALAGGSIVIGALLAYGRLGWVVPVAVAMVVVFVILANSMARGAGREPAATALADQLKGLQARQQIVERLSVELNRAMRSGERLSCALVGIDGFREIADKFGRAAADSVRRTVGNLIAESCRQYDSAGYYDDERFLVVLPVTELDNAARACERLRRRIEAGQFACHGEGLTVTISTGVTQADVDAAETADVLIARADKALERATNEGRNRVSALATLAFVERTATPIPAS
jgi:diguanylate cyclase (GGDEF)-like protein